MRSKLNKFELVRGRTPCTVRCKLNKFECQYSETLQRGKIRAQFKEGRALSSPPLNNMTDTTDHSSHGVLLVTPFLLDFDTIHQIQWIQRKENSTVSNVNRSYSRNPAELNCHIRVFRLEPDIAILYRFVLQNDKTKYYPTPSGNRTRAPCLQFQHAPF